MRAGFLRAQWRGNKPHSSRRCIWAFFAVLCLGLPAAGVAAVTVTIGTADKQVLVGTVVTPDQVFDGKVVIEGETITCVAVDCEEPEGASVFKITKAFIFPGFVGSVCKYIASRSLPRSLRSKHCSPTDRRPPHS